MISVAVTIYVLVAIIAVVRPKIGVYAIWFTSWLYPIGLLHALLPLNIRFDDLYLLWITLVVFIASIGKYDTKSRVLILSILWFLAILFGNAVGVLTGPTQQIWRLTLARVGKGLYIPLIGYCIWKTSKSEKDIKGHIIAIMVAGMGAAVIGIMQVKVPHLVRMWEIPRWLYQAVYQAEVWGEIIRRAGGALGVQYFAITTMTLVIIATRFLASHCGSKIRLLSVFGVPFFGIGLIFSNTRGPMVGAILGVLYMIVRQKRRFLTLLISSGFLLYVMFGTALPGRIIERFTGAQATVEASLQTRMEIWNLYLTNFSIHYFFFGRGFIPEYQRIGFTAHNSYIGAIVYTGLIGTVITALLLFWIWRDAKLMLVSAQSFFSYALANCIRPVLIATLFAGMFIEFLQSHHMRLVVTLGVLVERCLWLQSQAEAGGQEYAEMDSYITEDAAAAAIAKTGYEYNWGT